jgi:SAM-dependent methyltransferase
MKRPLKICFRAAVLAFAVCILPCGLLAADANSTAVQTNAAAAVKKPDVIYVPTPQPVVDKMLEMAEIKKGDIVYDLGCGDGRIVVTAAKKYGVKAIGVDIDPQRIKEAQENVRSNGVAQLVTIKQADIFELDFSDATVVTLYLLPQLNVRLMPKLAKLKPGTRIVSNDFDMKGAKPREVVNMPGHYEQDYGDIQRTIYKWVVPWEKEEKPD